MCEHVQKNIQPLVLVLAFYILSINLQNRPQNKAGLSLKNNNCMLPYQNMSTAIPILLNEYHTDRVSLFLLDKIGHPL